MEIDKIEYEKFVEWCRQKNDTTSFTQSEYNFARQMFEFIVDYPSFEKKLKELGSKLEVFSKIQRYVKEK